LFKFEEFWTRDIASHSVIAKACNSPFNGSTAYALSRKIKASKAALKDWNIQHFGNIHFKIKNLLAELNRVQCSPMMNDSLVLEDKIQLALHEELLREKSL
jgi:hypothetical protein